MYKIKLGTFEGPFDLLVYLIENARMDIYDIKISEITGQYIAYLEEMKKMDVAVGSEFMVLAAQLIEIKTRMLLPRNTDIGEGIVEEDPRAVLVEKILEYRKFKEVARILEERESEAVRVFEKPQEDISEYQNQPDEYLNLDIEQFIRAFKGFLHRKQKVEEVKKRYVRVKRDRESSENRMVYIRSVFRMKKTRRVPFSDLVVNAKDKYDVILSFTSVLEMMKARQLDAAQKVTYGDITVKAMEDFEKYDN